MQHLLKWLNDESLDKSDISYETNDWTLIHDTVPQQKGSVDCGVFLTICADFLSDDLPLIYTQQDMDSFRKKIGTFIIKGTLGYPLIQ
jgi:Ulp1 family protease